MPFPEYIEDDDEVKNFIRQRMMQDESAMPDAMAFLDNQGLSESVAPAIEEEQEPWSQEQRDRQINEIGGRRQDAIGEEKENESPVRMDDLEPEKNYGFDSSMDTNALKAAQDKAQLQMRQADLNDGADDIARAIAGATTPKDSYWQKQKESAQNPVKNLIQQRLASQQDREAQLKGEYQSPDSARSKVFQNIYKKTYPGNDFNGMSVNDLEMANKPLSAAMIAKARAAARTQNFNNSKMVDAIDPITGNPVRITPSQNNVNNQFSKDVEKFGEKIAPLQDINNAVSGVEEAMGFKLDDADVDIKNDKIKVGGKVQDLPGVSLPLVGRVAGYSPNARVLQSAMAKAFNVELKDRSGATITDTELERLKIEFGSGKFNTEAEMIDALKRYRNAANRAMKNTEARFKPQVSETYNNRLNQSQSKESDGTPPGMKKQVNKKTGEIRFVPR